MFARLFGKKTSSSRPEVKFTLENLRSTCLQLEKHVSITPQNKENVVELIRSITELLIWGDQHDPRFFDVFAERRVLAQFLRILSSLNCPQSVQKQIIQSISMLLQNTNSDMSIFYILSNNYINDLIVYPFDFSNEDLLATYISFLKALSLRLNSTTIHFFFNSEAGDFPLYTEALQYFKHPDNMVRIFVRTLTLNVYKCNDKAMQQFILDKSAAPYFSNLAWFLKEQLVSFTELTRTATPASLNKLDEFVEQQLDVLYYLHDITSLGISALADALVDQLLAHLTLPVLIGALRQRHRADRHAGKDARRNNTGGSARARVCAMGYVPAQVVVEGEDANIPDNTNTTTTTRNTTMATVSSSAAIGVVSADAEEAPLPSHIALLFLSQLLRIFSHSPFLNSLVTTLLSPRLPLLAHLVIANPPKFPVKGAVPLSALIYPKSEARDVAGTVEKVVNQYASDFQTQRDTLKRQKQEKRELARARRMERRRLLVANAAAAVAARLRALDAAAGEEVVVSSTETPAATPTATATGASTAATTDTAGVAPTATGADASVASATTTQTSSAGDAIDGDTINGDAVDSDAAAAATTTGTSPEIDAAAKSNPEVDTGAETIGVSVSGKTDGESPAVETKVEAEAKVDQDGNGSFGAAAASAASESQAKAGAVTDGVTNVTADASVDASIDVADDGIVSSSASLAPASAAEEEKSGLAVDTGIDGAASTSSPVASSASSPPSCASPTSSSSPSSGPDAGPTAAPAAPSPSVTPDVAPDTTNIGAGAGTNPGVDMSSPNSGSGSSLSASQVRLVDLNLHRHAKSPNLLSSNGSSQSPTGLVHSNGRDGVDGVALFDPLSLLTPTMRLGRKRKIKARSKISAGVGAVADTRGAVVGGAHTTTAATSVADVGAGVNTGGPTNPPTQTSPSSPASTPAACLPAPLSPALLQLGVCSDTDTEGSSPSNVNTRARARRRGRAASRAAAAAALAAVAIDTPVCSPMYGGNGGGHGAGTGLGVGGSTAGGVGGVLPPVSEDDSSAANGDMRRESGVMSVHTNVNTAAADDSDADDSTGSGSGSGSGSSDTEEEELDEWVRADASSDVSDTESDVSTATGMGMGMNGAGVGEMSGSYDSRLAWSLLRGKEHGWRKSDKARNTAIGMRKSHISGKRGSEKLRGSGKSLDSGCSSDEEGVVYNPYQDSPPALSPAADDVDTHTGTSTATATVVPASVGKPASSASRRGSRKAGRAGTLSSTPTKPPRASSASFGSVRAGTRRLHTPVLAPIASQSGEEREGVNEPLSPLSPCPNNNSNSASSTGTASGAGTGVSLPRPPRALFPSPFSLLHHNPYRRAVLSLLTHGTEAEYRSVVCLLLSIYSNAHVDRATLLAAGVAPHAVIRQQRMLGALCDDGDTEDERDVAEVRDRDVKMKTVEAGARESAEWEQSKTTQEEKEGNADAEEGEGARSVVATVPLLNADAALTGESANSGNGAGKGVPPPRSGGKTPATGPKTPGSGMLAAASSSSTHAHTRRQSSGKRTPLSTSCPVDIRNTPLSGKMTPLEGEIPDFSLETQPAPLPEIETIPEASNSGASSPVHPSPLPSSPTAVAGPITRLLPLLNCPSPLATPFSLPLLYPVALISLLLAPLARPLPPTPATLHLAIALTLEAALDKHSLAPILVPSHLAIIRGALSRSAQRLLALVARSSISDALAATPGVTPATSPMQVPAVTLPAAAVATSSSSSASASASKAATTDAASDASNMGSGAGVGGSTSKSTGTGDADSSSTLPRTSSSLASFPSSTSSSCLAPSTSASSLSSPRFQRLLPRVLFAHQLLDLMHACALRHKALLWDSAFANEYTRPQLLTGVQVVKRSDEDGNNNIPTTATAAANVNATCTGAGVKTGVNMGAKDGLVTSYRLPAAMDKLPAWGVTAPYTEKLEKILNSALLWTEPGDISPCSYIPGEIFPSKYAPLSCATLPMDFRHPTSPLEALLTEIDVFVLLSLFYKTVLSPASVFCSHYGVYADSPEAQEVWVRDCMMREIIAKEALERETMAKLPVGAEAEGKLKKGEEEEQAMVEGEPDAGAPADGDADNTTTTNPSTSSSSAAASTSTSAAAAAIPAAPAATSPVSASAADGAPQPHVLSPASVAALSLSSLFTRHTQPILRTHPSSAGSSGSQPAAPLLSSPLPVFAPLDTASVPHPGDTLAIPLMTRDNLALPVYTALTQALYSTHTQPRLPRALVRRVGIPLPTPAQPCFILRGVNKPGGNMLKRNDYGINRPPVYASPAIGGDAGSGNSAGNGTGAGAVREPILPICRTVLPAYNEFVVSSEKMLVSPSSCGKYLCILKPKPASTNSNAGSNTNTSVSPPTSPSAASASVDAFDMVVETALPMHSTWAVLYDARLRQHSVGEWRGNDAMSQCVRESSYWRNDIQHRVDVISAGSGTTVDTDSTDKDAEDDDNSDKLSPEAAPEAVLPPVITSLLSHLAPLNTQTSTGAAAPPAAANAAGSVVAGTAAQANVCDVCVLVRSPYKPHATAVQLVHSSNEYNGCMLGDVFTQACNTHTHARSQTCPIESAATALSLPTPVLPPPMLSSLCTAITQQKPVSTPALSPSATFGAGPPPMVPIWVIFLRYSDEVTALSSVFHINTLHVRQRQSSMDYLLHCSQLSMQLPTEQMAYMHSLQHSLIRVANDGVYAVADASTRGEDESSGTKVTNMSSRQSDVNDKEDCDRDDNVDV